MKNIKLTPVNRLFNLVTGVVVVLLIAAGGLAAQVPDRNALPDEDSSSTFSLADAYLEMFKALPVSEGDIKELLRLIEEAESPKKIGEAYVRLLRKAGVDESLIAVMGDAFEEAMADAIVAAEPETGPDLSTPDEQPGSGSIKEDDNSADVRGIGKQAADCKPGVLEVFMVDSQGNRQRVLVMKGVDDPELRVDGLYKNEGEGHPFVELGRGGFGGYFEMHGAPRRGQKYAIEEWWLQANGDGTLVKLGGRGVAPGVVYTLVVKYKGNEDGQPYQGSYWGRHQLTASFKDKEMYINGERSKGFDEQGSGAPPANASQTVPILVGGEKPVRVQKDEAYNDGSIIPRTGGDKRRPPGATPQ